MLTICLLLVISCQNDEVAAKLSDEAIWMRDVLAVMDDLILQADDGSTDFCSPESDDSIFIKSKQTLLKIRSYIENAVLIQDVTNVYFSPSPGPCAYIDGMSFCNYEKASYRYPDNTLILFTFRKSDSIEFLAYIKSVQQTE